MRKRRKVLDKQGLRCSVCGKHGSGPHARYVLNERKKRYEPYFYMAHYLKKVGNTKKVKWCYLGRRRDLRKAELRAVKVLEHKRAKRRKKKAL